MRNGEVNKGRRVAVDDDDEFHDHESIEHKGV